MHAVAERTGRTVGEVGRMPEREFRDWCVWLDREPSVGDRLDWWLAHLLAAVLNANSFRQTPVQASELLPDRWGDRPPVRQRGRLRGAALVAALRGYFGG